MNNQPIIDTTSKQDEYIEILKKHFPSVINQLDDGSYTIDKEQLQLMVEPKNCKIIEDGYGLKWVGKKEAYHNAYIHNNKILKPLVDDSKHFDTTSNILIKGDNLDALKLLKKNYFEKVKMIYIDPPYNTQSDGFIYNDNFTKSQEDVLEELGYSEDQKEYIKNIAGAKTHSGWLSFMYPRLLLARDLLKDDGVIFISIDENEQTNLKLLCDDVFGAENFIACITVVGNPRGRDYGGVAKMHDYILVYSKSEETRLNDLNDPDKVFPFCDEFGEFEIRELRNRNIAFNSENRPNLYYPFYINPIKVDANGFFEISLTYQQNWIELYPKISQGYKTVWRWGTLKSNENINKEIVAKKMEDGGFQIIEKYRKRTKMARSVWWEKEYNTEKGTLEVKALFAGKKIFAFPKPTNMIKHLLEMGVLTLNSPEIILDFFAGSGTTGDAVMKLNAEDGGNRKFILVQLPEKIDPKKSSESYKFVSEELKKEPTIFEITAERLRRAGQKILKDNKESKEPKDLSSLDIGFKVYEVADDQYNSIYDKKFNDVSQAELALIKSDDIVKADSLTILTNLLLGSGIALDTKIDVLLADSLYRVDDKLFILKEFDLQPELFNGIEYATIYARYFTNDSFIANLTSFIDKDKIIVKG
jgi:adenine-specific DNA-methyltransferase